jgi:cytochrome c-type protein NapC
MTPNILIGFLFILSLALVVLLFVRPALTRTREGKILAFVALFLFPLLCSGIALAAHMERSKTTAFCLSCHTMEPYGRSLNVDDPRYLAAAHFQNRRVPTEAACYTCHTDYVLYGGITAKIRGLRHAYVQFLGTPPPPGGIRLYSAYNNRECLHCHLGARSFEEWPLHLAVRDQVVSNDISCVSSGCHDTVHNITGLGEVNFWSPTP